jgi:hypothetical protein
VIPGCRSVRDSIRFDKRYWVKSVGRGGFPRLLQHSEVAEVSNGVRLMKRMRRSAPVLPSKLEDAVPTSVAYRRHGTGGRFGNPLERLRVSVSSSKRRACAG